jgi:hypothetical protein
MVRNGIYHYTLRIDQLFYFAVRVVALPTPPKIFLVDFSMFAAAAGVAKSVAGLLFERDYFNPLFSFAIRALAPNEFGVKPGILTDVLSASNLTYPDFFFRFVHYHLPPQVI